MVVPNMSELNFTDSELYYHVRNALTAAVQGDCDFYNQMVSVMHHKERLADEEVALLVTCLKAVAGAVSCINIVHHRSLLGAIFGMSLWDYGTDVMDALVELLVSLASSNGEYVDLCLELLIVNFMPPWTPASASYFLDILKQPQGLAKKTQVLDRVHSTLKDIACVVPLSPLRLEKIVSERMPNIYTKEPFIVMYMENILRLESSPIGDLVGSTIITVLVDRLIDLDVEIAWDDILQEDFQNVIFDMELEDLDVHVDDIEHDCSELTREALIQKFLCGNLFAQKLDSLMVLAFEHLKLCFESGRLVQVFKILLQSFQKTVLTAYKSKFAQLLELNTSNDVMHIESQWKQPLCIITRFVIFYACSLDPDICGKKFVDLLVNIFVSNPHPEWRMSAVGYLASYLARGKFVHISSVSAVLESVVNWCFLYCKTQDGGINPTDHRVFYAGCQATMYVLCFRMRQMLAVPSLNSHLRLIHISDILGHPLKPLQVCLPSIVEEFLRMMKTYHLFSLPQSFDDYGLLESEHSRAFGGIERFDMFFPFDPCLLRKCDSFIRPSYVYWSMVRSSSELDDEDDTGDEDLSEADAGHAGSSWVNSDIDDDCNYFLDKMSITPRDSRLMPMPSQIRPSASP